MPLTSSIASGQMATESLTAAARGAAVEALVAAAVADHDRAAFGAAGGVALDAEGGRARGAEVHRDRLRGCAVAVGVTVRVAVAVAVGSGVDDGQRIRLGRRAVVRGTSRGAPGARGTRRAR